MTQKAAVTALGDDLTETYVMRDAFLKRRALMLEELGKIDGLIINEPEGAFYVYPDVSAYFGKSFEGKRIENAS